LIKSTYKKVDLATLLEQLLPVCVTKLQGLQMDVVVLKFTWQHLEERLLNVRTPVAEVELTGQDEHRDTSPVKKTARAFLLEHQVTSLPASVHCDKVNAVSHLPLGSPSPDAAERTCEDVIADAMKAYNAFDINTAVQRYAV
jgi:hypothetical protein